MTAPDPPPGRGFWFALALGGAIAAFGIGGLIATTSVGNAFQVGAWVVGADLVHDVVLAPIAVLVSVALTRVMPLPWRAPVRSALAASAVVVIVAYPALRGFGRETAPGNSSVQPLDYDTALVTVLVVVWTLAGTWLAAIAVHDRRKHSHRRRAAAGRSGA